MIDSYVPNPIQVLACAHLLAFLTAYSSLTIQLE